MSPNTIDYNSSLIYKSGKKDLQLNRWGTDMHTQQTEVQITLSNQIGKKIKVQPQNSQKQAN